MAAKGKLKTRAARAREEMRQTGRLVLRAPALVRFAECVMRLLLGAVLAGAEIFGGYAPFGLGMVACSGSGLDGFCALTPLPEQSSPQYKCRKAPPYWQCCRRSQCLLYPR